MSQLAYLLLIAIGLIVGTGAYVVYPLVLYVLFGIVSGVYSIAVVTKKVKNNPISNLVFAIYVAFLMMNYVRDSNNEAAALYINFFLGICAYFLVIKMLSLKPEPSAFRWLPLLSLLIIALGIVLELNGLIDFTKANITSVDEGLLRRPGGFLNPNMSAALSLIWLYIAFESKPHSPLWLRLACLGVCFFILSLAQSRSALLFSSIYFLCKLREAGFKNLKYFLIAIFFAPLLLAYFGQVDYLVDLYDAIFTRAQGDSSSDERYLLIKTGVATFGNNPIFGLGMRGMYRYFGLGTHNEIVEWLVNFGLVGLFVMLLIFFRFYYVNSIKYLCLCIFPLLLFSHNFFETTALQVALAYAFHFGTQSVKAGAGRAVRRKASAIASGRYRTSTIRDPSTARP